MPMVNGKKYPYTKAGKEAAMKAKKKSMKPVKGSGSIMGKPSRYQEQDKRFGK